MSTVLPTSQPGIQSKKSISAVTDTYSPPANRFKAAHFIQSLGFATQGISFVFKTERNFRTHSVLAVLVLLSGLALHLHLWEWGIISVCIGLMLAMELFNTALEHAVDLMVGNLYHEKAKRAKDAAAGACLAMAVCVSLAGLCIFVPHVVQCLHGLSVHHLA